MEAGMPSVMPLIRSLQRVARDQQRVLANLQKLLPTMNGAHTNNVAKTKQLRCSRCSRRFALPMNLGRHMQATHRRKATKKAA
jgi:hypothetical protein